jgi:signal transduction histidine kinase
MIQNSLITEEKRSKKIFVRMLTGLMAFTLVVAVLYSILGLPAVSYLNFISAIAAPAGIWLTRKNYFLLAKILLHLIVLFVVLGSCVIYGKESMILSFLVPLVQSFLTIFSRKEWPWSLSFLLIILVLAPWMVVSDFRYHPLFLEGGTLVTVQLINVVGAIGFSVIQISYATWVNEQFREALEIRNEESENTNQLLKSALSTRDQLFNMLAHDLRSPFVALESGLIIMDEISIPEDKRWIIKEIRDNAKNTLTLLDNTLNWARSQTNNIRYEPTDLNVQDILNKVQHNFSVHLKSKGITLMFESKTDIRVFADSHMLLSIVQNLVSNAIKFTRRDGHIWISVIGLVHGTEFRVRDTGLGMSPEEVTALQSGGTFSKPGTGREKGHGVGLLLVREFLSRHGSELQIKSAPGMGSEFSFTWSPVLRAEVEFRIIICFFDGNHCNHFEFQCI